MKVKLKYSIAVLIICLCACASILGTDKTLTPKEIYLEGLQWYNFNLEQYLGFYDMASAEDQTELKRQIDPKFKDVSLALDTLKLALGTGNQFSAVDDYLAAKNFLVKQLILHGIIEGGT